MLTYFSPFLFYSTCIYSLFLSFFCFIFFSSIEPLLLKVNWVYVKEKKKHDIYETTISSFKLVHFYLFNKKD